MALKLGKVLRTSKKDGKIYTNYELRDSNGYTLNIKPVYFEGESEKAKAYRRNFLENNISYIRDADHEAVLGEDKDNA